jgi:hypothetical protein
VRRRHGRKIEKTIEISLGNLIRRIQPRRQTNKILRIPWHKSEEQVYLRKSPPFENPSTRPVDGGTREQDVVVVRQRQAALVLLGIIGHYHVSQASIKSVKYPPAGSGFPFLTCHGFIFTGPFWLSSSEN